MCIENSLDPKEFKDAVAKEESFDGNINCQFPCIYLIIHKYSKKSSDIKILILLYFFNFTIIIFFQHLFSFSILIDLL